MDELEKKTIETSDGEKIEVYDAVKVEEAITKTADGFKTEKDTLETSLKEATEKLEKVDEKDKDFKELRESKEKIENELKEAITKNETSVKDLTEKLDNTEQKYRKETLVKSIAGDDKDLLEKVEHHMKNTVSSMPEKTPEELEAKIKAAYTQATGIIDADKLNTVISSAGGGGTGESKGKVSSDLKDFGKNFGLKDEDWDQAAKINKI